MESASGLSSSFDSIFLCECSCDQNYSNLELKLANNHPKFHLYILVPEKSNFILMIFGSYLKHF